MIRIISAFLNVAGNFFQMRSFKVVRVSSESTHRGTCITAPLGVHNSSDRRESSFHYYYIFFSSNLQQLRSFYYDPVLYIDV